MLTNRRPRVDEGREGAVRLRRVLKGEPVDPELEALWARYLAGDVSMPGVLTRLKRRAGRGAP